MIILCMCQWTSVGVALSPNTPDFSMTPRSPQWRQCICHSLEKSWSRLLCVPVWKCECVVSILGKGSHLLLFYECCQIVSEMSFWQKFCVSQMPIYMMPLLSLQSVRRPKNYEMCVCTLYTAFSSPEKFWSRLDFVHILEMQWQQQPAHVVKGHRHMVPLSNFDPSYFPRARDPKLIYLHWRHGHYILSQNCGKQRQILGGVMLYANLAEGRAYHSQIATSATPICSCTLLARFGNSDSYLLAAHLARN